MSSLNCPSKIVVFDVDETLGFFVEFGLLWDALLSYKKINNIDLDFNTILDLYPEFIRPNIYTILNYLKHKKETNECIDVMIYTNNQGPKEWVMNIKKYFENKINYKLFGQIISAFKINGKQIELCRTTHNKTHKDFIKCSKLPLNTQICFLDDTFYPDMNHDNVYYIKVRPYIYHLSFDLMMDRIEKNVIGNNPNIISFLKEYLNKYNFAYNTKLLKDYEIDKIITKKIMIHLQEFFQREEEKKKEKQREKDNKTKMKKGVKKNLTLKKNKYF
jgi:hypothetical protein